MMSLHKYFLLWLKLTSHSFMVSLSSRLSASLFFIGKILRFILFAVFLMSLFRSTDEIAGYGAQHLLFFYLTFNLIDTITQLFYREVYRFRPMVVNGDFDLILTKPLNPLFRALAGGADPLDFLMLVPYIAALAYVGFSYFHPGIVELVMYILFILNSLLIATGFHILVLSLAVVTTEIDHSIMIYRDLTNMGRVPVDIYREPLRSIISFIIPVGIMMTFPAKAFFGMLHPSAMLFSAAIGALFMYFSQKIWNYALRQYSSASS